jgi:tripartite-type tricarboxylate transporter receptor subunit TctC
MKICRRQFLNLARGTAATTVVASPARAQAYPSRPVRLIVGFSAGQSLDVTARIMGHWLSERFGQSFIVENRPGAASNIAASAVARATPDGHTLLVCATVNTINATLYPNLDFDFSRDFGAVASFARVPLVMEVNPAFPPKTVAELIAYAKANPGKITMASAGKGTVPHISGELFKILTGTDMLQVVYRGAGEALTDLLGGRVDVMFDNMPSSIGHIRAGSLWPLGVTGATRWEGLPGVPTVQETVPGFETSAWSGLVAPRRTPPEIIGALNVATNAAHANAALIAQLRELGASALSLSPSEFDKFIAEQTQRWAKVIKLAGIKLD